MKRMKNVLALLCVCAVLLSCALPMVGCSPKETVKVPSGLVDPTDPPKKDDVTEDPTEAPTQPVPENPTQPAPENPTQPAPENPTQPAPVDPTQPTPETPTQPEEDKDDGVIAELSASVTSENNILTQGVTLAGNSTISANVPQGVVLDKNTTQLVLTVTQKETSDSGVKLTEGQTMLPLDVHIQGISTENTAPITVNLGAILPKGLNIGNYTLYHVENGAAVVMSAVSTLADLDAHNEFVYDPADGSVTMSVASFSEIALVSEPAKWNGSFDFSWYTEDPEVNTFYIRNADQLAAFGAIVGGMAKDYKQNSFEGQTVVMLNDINIGDMDSENGIVFYPIGYYNNKGTYDRTDYVGDSSVVSGLEAFQGTFDGNGNTISNFYQNTWEMFGDYNDGYSGTPNYYKDAMGLFAATYGATIKNLIIDNFQSDGEFTPTGCVAAYAGGPGMVFENIILTNCNPRVYNTGNGGIVGLNYNSTSSGTADEITFRNITVDQSNKISALWGSYDVACGGIMGRLRENSLHNGKNEDGQKNTVKFINCHVSAIMDVNNDVCANYQYYQYRYCGMFIGTVDYIGDVPNVGLTDVVSAENCTYKIGTWNEYWYCELVANSLASYTHDYQFSRLSKISNVSEIQDENGNWKTAGNFVWIDENGDAQCYHIVKDGETYKQHMHEDSGVDAGYDVDGNGEADLKENRQRYMMAFNQLFTGYGWGSSPVYEFEGIDVGKTENSDKKFAVKDGFVNLVIKHGDAIAVKDIFELLSGVTVNTSSLNLYLSPVGEDSTVVERHISAQSLEDMGNLTFNGAGTAKITITDYCYCTPTTVTITVVLDEFEGDEDDLSWGFEEN